MALSIAPKALYDLPATLPHPSSHHFCFFFQQVPSCHGAFTTTPSAENDWVPELCKASDFLPTHHMQALNKNLIKIICIYFLHE